jgi:tetratricopeptide (TPR) repeat protein
MRALAGVLLIGGIVTGSAAVRAEDSAASAVKAAAKKGDVEAAAAALASAGSELEALAKTVPGEAAQRLDDLASLVLSISGGAGSAIDAVRSAAERGRSWRERAFTPAGKEVAKSWSLLATIAFTTGDWRAADASARKAVALDPTADNLETLAVVSMYQGRLAEADPTFVATVALRRAAAPPEPAKLAETLNAYAELLRRRDRTEEAAKTFDEAIGIAKPLEDTDPLLLARLETNRAGLAKDRGRLGDAEEGVRRSIALKEKAAATGASADLSIGWLNLAEIYRLEGNHDAAEPLYRKSLEAARKELGPDHPELAVHLSQLAVLERDTGRLAEAERLFGEAAAHLERTIGEHPMLAQTRNDLAEVEIARGRPEEAIAQAERALAIRTKALGAEHSETAASLVTLARAERARGGEGDEGRALGHVDRALTILRATGNYPETAIDALSVRAAIDRSGGRIVDAVRDLREAIGLVETMRPVSGGGEATRAAFLGKYTDLYERLVALEASRGNVAEAFAAAERGRGRALLDLLASARVDLLSGIPEPRRSALASREASARAEVAEWRARAAAARERTDRTDEERRKESAAADVELARASTAFRLAHEEIRNASPVWRGASGGAPIDLPAARRDVLGKGEVLLVYAVGPEESWVLVVPRGPADPRAFALTVAEADAARFGIDPGALTAASLDDALFGIAGVVPAIAAPPVAGSDLALEGLAALYRILLPEGARAMLAKAGEVVLVPDGSLFRLPFEALVVGKDRVWLDALPPIRYGVSATVLRELEKPRGKLTYRSPDTLSVSNPAYDRAGATRWAPLPKTALETTALSEVRPLDSLSGALADEAHVRQAIEGRRYLHLATHGVVDRGRGDLFAALVLAPPASPVTRAEDDGLLHLYEIYELDLASELVVLSACSSGTGSGVPGEGTFALTRGFQAAGARRTIGTLWPVEDEAAAKVVSEAFRRIGTATTYAAALRDAKRAVRSDPRTRAPFYWAPFVLSGPR